jgi:hypothetical protein
MVGLFPDLYRRLISIGSFVNLVPGFLDSRR